MFAEPALGTITSWLHDESLYESVVLGLNPRVECPPNWPLGWKISLERLINELKSEAAFAIAQT